MKLNQVKVSCYAWIRDMKQSGLRGYRHQSGFLILVKMVLAVNLEYLSSLDRNA